MDGHQHPRVSLLALDTRDPDFPRQAQAWAGEVQGEIAQLVAQTKSTIAESRTLVAEIDRILAHGQAPAQMSARE